MHYTQSAEEFVQRDEATGSHLVGVREGMGSYLDSVKRFLTGTL
jgi:hypothetical protein